MILESEEPRYDRENLGEKVIDNWIQNGSEAPRKFDKDTCIWVGRFCIVHVYAHQTKDIRKIPNLFCSSANDIADVATHIARKINTNEDEAILDEDDRIYIPAFSNRFIYTLDGRYTDKGAVEHFKIRMDEEILKRAQHRIKQGLIYRILPQCGLTMEQLSEKSTYRDVMKGTATCWTRSIYKDKELKNQIIQMAISPSQINDKDVLEAILQCPFCNKWIDGDLEHIHMYCENEILTEMRNWANLQIEKTLEEICQKEDLHNRLNQAARESELQERPIVWNNKIIHTRRERNISVLTDKDINRKLEENADTSERLKQSFKNYPLCHKCGFISSLEEDQFNINDATISDIAYMGLIPMTVIKAFEKEKGKRKLISNVIWRTIIMQKTISYMMKEMKKKIMVIEKDSNLSRKTEEPPLLINETEKTKATQAFKLAKPLTDRTNRPNNGIQDGSGKARKRKLVWKYKDKRGNRNRKKHKKKV